MSTRANNAYPQIPSRAVWHRLLKSLSKLLQLAPADLIDLPEEDLETLMATKVKPCATGFACLICGRTIKERKNMRTHMSNQHMTPPRYNCPPCNQIFEKYIAFYLHVRKCHPDWQGIDYSSFRVD